MHGLGINSTSKSKTGQIPRPCFCSVGSVNLLAAHVLQRDLGKFPAGENGVFA